ncbi:hypothetical protein AMTR_s00003p00268020 [Amborella trichopoda]|uniref:Uncharacterized protein n=1 Tax=Amborella trichopoda TaxID=13333 RepID=W1P6C4_AMBTC|nr:hypothetical protein AMTR_s00003p00268020 [Amborella trichopoda]
MPSGDKPAAALGEGANPNAKQAKSAKPPPQKKDGAPGASSGATSEKKGVDRPPERKGRKMFVLLVCNLMIHRVEKTKRRALVKPTETKNRVELFRHLPQYVHGAQLTVLESKFFEVDQMHPHPAVYRVGL